MEYLKGKSYKDSTGPEKYISFSPWESIAFLSGVLKVGLEA
jgi:hypothetical protein